MWSLRKDRAQRSNLPSEKVKHTYYYTVKTVFIQEKVMDDNAEDIESQIDVPEDSIYYQYLDYVCFVPGVGAYIPFITTRDQLTDKAVRGMIFGTSEKEYYIN